MSCPATEWQNWNLNPACVTPEPEILTSEIHQPVPCLLARAKEWSSGTVASFSAALGSQRTLKDAFCCPKGWTAKAPR